MEKAIKDKVVGILVATNTLADGLNMPVRTILIPKPELGGDDMEIGLFLNLAGRAGRPFISEEGQVILAEGKENIDFEKYYLANENNIESSKGPIAEFLELDQKIAASDNLNKKKRLELEKKTYKAYFESLMLALIAEGIYTKLANDQQLIASLLFNTSETTLKERLNILLIETEEKFYKEYKVTEIMNSSGDYRVTARGLAIYKSGFSPYSGLDTISWLEKNKAVVNYFSSQKVDIYDPNFYQNWKVLIEKLIQTEECKLFLNLESYDSALSASQAVWVTLNWMKGDDIRKISGQFFEPKHGNLARFTCLSFLEGKLCPSLSWGLYGLSQWIKVVLGPNSEQIEENFKKLAKMIWFGCSTHLSLTLCGLDESRLLNRNDILELTSRISRKQIPNFISNPILLESGDFLQKLNVNSEAWLTEPSELLSDLIKIFKKK
jgi:hypothetical protein